MEIKNKIIVITGGSSGIGKALADALKADNTVVSLSRSGRGDAGIISYSADVSDYDGLKEVFSNIGGRFKKIDVLINSAGYGLSGITEYIPRSDAEKITAVNYLGVLFSSQFALKYMERGAKIINIGSLGGVSPMPFRALYNASKAAAHMLSLSMNAETRPLGISVCAVKLGDTATDFKDNRRKLGVSDTRYGGAAERVDAFVDSRGAEKKMSADAAAEKIIRILGKKRIRTSYIFGIKYKAASLLNAVAPGLVTKIVYKVMTGKPER
jgi:short-subunit dehydrogenase